MKADRLVACMLACASAASAASCVKLDFFLFDGDPADIEDYDFTTDELDGIDPARITSVLVPSANPDHMLHVVFVERDVTKLDGRIDPERGMTVLYSHGNSGNIKLYWHRVAHYEDMGFNVVVFDYRGYGASDGETTETHTYEDVATAYDWAVARDDVGDVLSVGYSMGGAPAIWLCSPESGRAVVGCFTESTFASTAKLLEDGTYYDFPSSWFLDVQYPSDERIRSVTVPFLMMHGTLDQRVGFENALILWENVKDNDPLNRFFACEGVGHRNVPLPGYGGEELPTEWSHPDELPAELRPGYEQYRARIVDFVAGL